MFSKYLGEVVNVCSTLYKFIWDTMYQLLSEFAKFCRRYDKNIVAYFFLGHGVVTICDIVILKYILIIKETSLVSASVFLFVWNWDTIASWPVENLCIWKFAALLIG